MFNQSFLNILPTTKSATIASPKINKYGSHVISVLINVSNADVLFSAAAPCKNKISAAKAATPNFFIETILKKLISPTYFLRKSPHTIIKHT